MCMCTIRIIVCVYTHHICMHQLHIRGIGPWKVGQLAASLYLWDVMWGQAVPTHREDWRIQVSQSHQFVYMFVSTAIHPCMGVCIPVPKRVYTSAMQETEVNHIDRAFQLLKIFNDIRYANSTYSSVDRFYLLFGVHIQRNLHCRLHAHRGGISATATSRPSIDRRSRRHRRRK